MLHQPHRYGPRRPVPCGRTARTAAVTVTALVTAVGGHALGGGGLPTLPGILLALLGLTGPGWWLARDERGWERLAAAQLAAQLGAHLVFEATADPSAAGHGHGDGLGPGIVLVAHLASAAVAAAWLRSGERRAVALSRRALAALFALVTALVGRGLPRYPGPALRRPASAAPRVREARLRHAIVHRGPPLPV
ncbi:hypothetical protein LWC35_28165 [Pseudonocardia kujensis]|uniref:hypothetical protein n=1 Tax=Pseudonocardia kujensis TaxID=1128675 RepID=UPI001E3FE31B|nr:hypothetical protein [Pseudonocardia kujensis]MCE0766753.1 hypothetical protein [Pseudonocardia kujensis]